METRQLQYFIALAQTGSFSKAAQALHITQSALSRSMQALEDDLGGKLLDRLGRRSLLTPLGEHVLQRAYLLVREVDNLKRSTEALQAAPQGWLRIGFCAGPSATIAAPFIRHVLAHHPGLRLEIRRGLPQAQLGDLKKASLDVIVADGRAYSPGDDLVIEQLTSLRGGAICRAGHPLAELDQVPFDRLCSFPILTTAISEEMTRFLVQHFGDVADPHRFTTVQCEELETLLSVTRSSDSIYLGVVGAAQSLLEQGLVKLLPLVPKLEVAVPVVLIRLAGRTEPQPVAILRDFARNMTMY